MFIDFEIMLYEIQYL